jgi:hypothetical protein
VPALERLAERAGVERVSVDPALAAAALGPALQTEVYRAVEEALAKVGAAGSLTVSFDPAMRDVRMSLRRLDVDIAVSELGALQARLDLIGGALTASGAELVIRIPIEPGADSVIAAFPQPRRAETPDGDRRALP